jgi:hypothetical protein
VCVSVDPPGTDRKMSRRASIVKKKAGSDGVLGAFWERSVLGWARAHIAQGTDVPRVLEANS